jgi:DNA repair ATPase RecN
MDNLELDVGGTKIKGVWIAILISFASTIGGGIWTASEFFNRLATQEQTVQDAMQVSTDIQAQFDDLKGMVDTQLNSYKNTIDVVQQQLADNDVSGLQGKLATLGTNLEQIMKRQSELLDMRDKIAEIEKTASEQSIKTQVQLDKLKQYDDDMKRIKREIDDLWNGMDALSNPLT